MLPLFSIITPSYQARPKLEATSASVLGQSKDLYDYWVVDGASNDGTLEWLQNQNHPAFHWVSEKDSGVYDAMNKGIGLAQGKFLLFLGAGDLLLPGSLERVAYFLHEHPSARPRFVYGDVREMETNQHFTAGLFTKSKICRGNICHQGIFYEREIFDLVGGYELRYPIMADWALNLRCFGDSRIEKLYLAEDIAEFEGGGLCVHTPDFAFAEDRHQLIRDRIGLGHALFVRIEEALKRRGFL